MNWKINYDFYRLSIVLKYLVMKNSNRATKESYKWLFILEKCMYVQIISKLKVMGTVARVKWNIISY